MIVSNILPRKDQLKEKVGQVNDFLKIKTTELGIGFIDHTNINPERHLKPKGLHLNDNGSATLQNNFINWINT